MVPFWTNVMAQANNQSPGVSPNQNNEQSEPLCVPIGSTGIKEAFPALSTSPGTDRVSARQLRAMPMNVLTGILNLFLLCGKLPKHLLESKTILIPKKDGATEPGDFRPITVSSVITRLYHKILANRFLKFINFDKRQRAFLPVDGCADSIFDLDLILRYHRQNFKPLYIA